MSKPKKISKIKNDISFSISVDTKLREAIEQRAKQERRSMSFVVREAIERHLGIEQAPAA
jgi:predicted transcriptional regulator